MSNTSYDNTELAFLELIKNKEQYMVLDNKSFVVFLNSSWGTGKTTFLNNIKEKVDKGNENDNKKYDFKFVYYDAWKHDDWSDPISPLVHCLKSDFDGIDDEVNKYVDAIASVGAKRGLNLLTRVISDVVQSKLGVSKDTIDEAVSIVKDVKQEALENESIRYSDEFEIYLKQKKAFSDYLKKKMDGNNIVFVIDELDRCKPIFAIETLEFIKHYFNECDVAFVFSTDIVQLGESIRAVYGNINYNIYLSKFYDYKYDYQQKPIENYIREEIIKCHKNVSTYVHSFEIHPYIDLAIVFAKMFKISYRELQKLVIVLKKAITIYFKNQGFLKKYSLNAIIFLIILKQIDIDSYYKLIYSKYVTDTKDGLPAFLREKYPVLRKNDDTIPKNEINALLMFIRNSRKSAVKDNTIEYTYIMACLSNT